MSTPITVSNFNSTFIEQLNANFTAIDAAIDAVDGYSIGVSSLADLKALPVGAQTGIINSQYRSSAGDGGGGTWVWRSGNQSANITADTQSGVWAAPDTDSTGASGAWQRLCDPASVRLEWFDQSLNPLQGALDYLGTAGGKITVPNRIVTITSPANSAADLTQMHICGEGNDSALYFTSAAGANGVGGLGLHMWIPDGTRMNREQVLIENVAILCGYYAAGGPTNGSGIGLYVGWKTAVGSVNLGLTIRNVQTGPRNKYAIGGNYAWWDTGIQVYNGRQVTLSNIYCFGAEQTARSGVGIDLNGGTVQVQMEDINAAEMSKGVYINGVCEGIQWNRGVTIGNDYGVYIDGNALGRALSTSTTSHTIGTGSKTFTVAHAIGGPDSLAWTTSGQTLYIRDASAPATNWMRGAITGYTTDTVTVNVTSVGGSGTFTDWLLSTHHKVSQVAMGDFHANNYLENFHLEWTAFTQMSRVQHQQYGASASFKYVNIVQDNDAITISDMVIGGGGVGGTGINVESVHTGIYDWSTDARNFYLSFHDIFFLTTVDYGIVLGEYTQHVDIHGIRYANVNPDPIIVNNVTGVNSDIRAYDCWCDDSRTVLHAALTANSATPSVAPDGINRWRTNNSAPTSITYFSNAGCIGNEFEVVINDANTTFVHSATLLLKGGINYSPAAGTVMRFAQVSSTIIREVSRLSGDVSGTSLNISGAATLSGALQLGNAYVAGAPAATGYVTLKDSTGTTYKVLVST